MANYLLAYHGGGMAPTEEERARIMEAWGKWFQALGPALVDGGNPTAQATAPTKTAVPIEQRLARIDIT